MNYGLLSSPITSSSSFGAAPRRLSLALVRLITRNLFIGIQHFNYTSSLRSGGGKTLFGDYTAHTWWLPSTSSSHLLNNKTHDGDGPWHIITYILMATTPRRHLLLVHHYRSDGVHVHKQWG